MKPSNFLPIILGTDMNAYHMAISFHEAYDLKPILIGREKMPVTSLSKVIDKVHIFPELADTDQFVAILKQLADEYQSRNRQLLLVGTNDQYVRLIIENEKVLREYYEFNYIDEPLMNQLQIKSNFYKLCYEYGLDAPATYYFDCSDPVPFSEPLVYPAIIKPSHGITYFKHKFAGQQKVYRVESETELKNIINKIIASGYREQLIIQEYIPGDDTFLWDSVIYISSTGKTQLVTFAQVVLQEHTVTAIGNYTALITRYNELMMHKLQLFLESIGYVGFANFDLKYDRRDGKFKVLEVNIRQGRSSYYVTQLGNNMATYLVDDLIFEQERQVTYLKDHYLFTVVPIIVLRHFVANADIRREVSLLIAQKKFGNPLFYKKDKHIRRKLYLFARQINYYRKYKNNKW